MLIHPILHRRNESDWRRGYAYNHSTFCDLVITGLVGLRPRRDGILEVNPLFVDASDISYFVLDGLPYHGRTLTILWDGDGRRYGCGAGLQLWVDGVVVAVSPVVRKLLVYLPQLVMD